MTSHDCCCGCLHKKLPANAKKTLNAFMASDQLSGATLALSVKDKEICGFSHSPSVFTVEITQRRGLSSDTHWFIWGWNEINFYVVRALSHRESEKWDGNTIVVIILIFSPHTVCENHTGVHITGIYCITSYVWAFVWLPQVYGVFTHTPHKHTHTHVQGLMVSNLNWSWKLHLFHSLSLPLTRLSSSLLLLCVFWSHSLPLFPLYPHLLFTLFSPFSLFPSIYSRAISSQIYLTEMTVIR